MKRLIVLWLLIATEAMALDPQTITPAGTTAVNAVGIQGVTGGIPMPISGSISTTGAADTVGASATFNANTVCATVLLAGQQGAGFFLASGTLTATFTPGFSTDATPASPGCTGGNWTASQFIDGSGNTTPTQAVTNPNGFINFGVRVISGARCARVCTSAFTVGTASGYLVSTTAQSTLAASADVTDRAGRLLGKVYGSDSNILATANTGRLQVDVITGGGSNASIGATGAAVPGSASLSGGSATTSAPTYVTGNMGGLSLNLAGGLRVDGSGVTQPVSAASLPLPAGAAIESGHLATIDTSTARLPAQGQALAAASLPVVLTAIQQTALTPPAAITGFALEAGHLATIDTSTAKIPAQGQALAAASMPIVLTAAQVATLTPLATVATTPPANASTNVAQINGVVPTEKAASTAPVAADTALVVAQSPQASTMCSTTKAISQTAGTDLLTSTNKIHICSIVLVSATAQSVSLVEGTGAVCATGGVALIGSTTVANGVPLAITGGFTAVSDRPWLKSITAADHLCLLQSGAGLVAGVITYQDAL